MAETTDPELIQNQNMRERIDDLRGRLEMAEIGYLTRRGWRHTSSTPDFHWRWVKTMEDGTRLMVDRDTALSIEGVSRD